MNPDTIAKIAQLLAQAGSAHHHFEQTELKGVYDQAWPEWYANHLLENKLDDLLVRPVSREELSDFLFQSNETRTQQHPQPNWVDYTAREIAATL
jgi:hypothetical protein